LCESNKIILLGIIRGRPVWHLTQSVVPGEPRRELSSVATPDSLRGGRSTTDLRGALRQLRAKPSPRPERQRNWPRRTGSHLCAVSTGEQLTVKENVQRSDKENHNRDAQHGEQDDRNHLHGPGLDEHRVFQRGNR